MLFREMKRVLNTITDKTLVLDVDECLVRSHVEDDAPDADIMSPANLIYRSRYFEVPYEGGSFWGIKRPYLDQFLS